MDKKYQKINACLWFDNQAAEASEFYTGIFKDSEIGRIARYSDAGKEIHGQPEGSVMTCEFRLDNQWFVGLNGGPHFTINPAISFFVSRDTKEEINELWKHLSRDGKVLMPLDKYPFSDHYGWVQDKYGVSWQLILPQKEGDWRPRIVPCLLFVGEHCGLAEAAMDTYLSIFKSSSEGQKVRYDASHPQESEGNIMYADFSLGEQWFAVMDSADDHSFGFNEAISLMVYCSTQEEIDYYWEQLGKGGDLSSQQCGWLKDRFGVSWQIVPHQVPEILARQDAGSRAVTTAIMNMKKLDLPALEKVYEQAAHENQ